MGYFYTGFDYKNRKQGYFKIGETGQKSLASRLATIRQHDSFQCLGYIALEGETKAERLLIESHVRVMLSRTDGLEHTQNDHFLYGIESKDRKYEQAYEIAEIALRYAEDICKLYGIKYSRGTKQYKRG